MVVHNKSAKVYTDSMSDAERIKSVLDQRKLSQRELAKLTGIHESVISRIIRGSRELRTSEMRTIEQVLGVDFSRLSTTALPLERTVSLSRPVRTPIVPVIAIIAVGVWRDRGALVQDRTQVAASPDPRLEGLEQYACRIDGPEYGALAGQFAVCVKYFDIRSKVAPADTVHVVRQVGDLEEHTLKVVQYVGDAVFLTWDNNGASTSVELSPDVSIQGLVVGFFQPTRF